MDDFPRDGIAFVSPGIYQQGIIVPVPFAASAKDREGHQAAADELYYS
jgi:hypothetical protein